MSQHGPRAWRTALGHAEPTRARDAEIPRLVLEVAAPDGAGADPTVLVTVSLRDGRLVAVDDRGERDSPHSRAAIAWLSGLAFVESTSDPGSSRAEPLGARISLAPPPPSRGLDVVRELAMALVRTGLAGARRGAMDELLRRGRASGDLRLTRWTARFDAAIASEDLPLLAQLARGALVSDVPPARSRVDLSLVEIAREHVDGASANAIQRRHLLEPSSATFFVEEHEAAGLPGSIGPMPRTLEVGLAEVLDDPGQPTIRVLQYTTTPGLADEAFARLDELASRDLSTVAARVQSLVRASPAFAEPVVLFAPSRWEPGLRALDAAGRALPWASDEASCLRLSELVTGEPPTLLVLRACPRHGEHAFVPLSCVVRDEARGAALVRLRG